MKYKLTLIFVFLSLIAFAQEPSMDEIRTFASQFMLEKTSSLSQVKKSVPDFKIGKISRIIQNGEGMFNVVELLPEGFVVLSNNKAIDPLIAYSMSSGFDFSTDSSNVLYHLIMDDISQRTAFYTNGIDKWAKEDQAVESMEAVQQWPAEGTTVTGGWIESTWNQGYPYNQLFPIDPLTQDRVVTGCVTTALAQVLHYHGTFGEYPLDYRAEYTSQGQNNAIIHIDGDYQVADFASFSELNDLLAVVKSKYASGTSLTDIEISAINFLAAIMVKANFTSFSTSANTGNIPPRMLDFFRYGSCDITYNLSAEVFSSLISNMRMGLPALLSIHNQEGYGHLIICDGYNSDNFFHLNFGWGANAPEAISEVWYNIPQEIPADYSIVSSAIYNINPLPREVDVSESLVELFPMTSLQTSSIYVLAANNTSIDLSCDKVLLSENGVDFTTTLNNVALTAGVEKEILIRYTPEYALVRDFMEVKENNKAIAYVEVRGYPSGNMIEGGSVAGIWDDKEKPYLVAGDIYVDSNHSLEIREGVRIYFLEETGLTIKDGSLQVKGTAQYPVLLTTLAEEARWKGIDFINSGDDDLLLHAVVLNSNSSGVEAVNTDLVITNCMIANNSSNRGGGISLISSNTSLTGCIVVNNYNETWNDSFGGGLYAENSSLRIVNSTFSKNANLVGGGVYAVSSNLELINSIFWDNYSWPQQDQSGVVLHKEIAFNPTNTVIKASNCIIRDLEGMDPFNCPLSLLNSIRAENVVDQNPGFQNPSSTYGAAANPLAANWRISRTSIAVNNGSKDESLGLPESDFYGNPRFFLEELDMGAAEFVDSCRALSVTPLSGFDFPATEVNSSSSLQVQIKNTGVGTIAVSTGISGEDCFTADHTYEMEELQPGDSFTVTLSYSAEKINQSDTAYFALFTTAENYEYQKIRLTGTSVQGQMVQGGVSGVWTEDGGPYIVTGDTWVEEEASLIIEKGTEIYVSGKYSFDVSNASVLQVKGTLGDSVKFIGLSDWKGISFTGCSSMQSIQYLSLSGVKHYPALTVEESPIRLYHSHFQNNDQCIFILNRNSAGHMHDIRYCSFQENYKNILYFENGDESQKEGLDTLLIIGNSFWNNNVSSLIKTNVSAACKLAIDQNYFFENVIHISLIDHMLTNYSAASYQNSMIGNQIYNNTGSGMPGISSQNDRISICNNLIAQNSSTNNWSALLYMSGSHVEVLNNTVAYNEIQTSLIRASFYSSLDGVDDVKIIRNNIFYANGNSDFIFYGNMNSLHVDYNLLENQYAGSNQNINSYPLFSGDQGGKIPGAVYAESDWYLAENSPCIDAGYPGDPYNDIGGEDNPEIARFPSMGSITNDLGAFGGNNNNFYETESVTICEGSSHSGFSEEGSYYKALVAKNGRDSIVVVTLNVIESDLHFSNPLPQVQSHIPGGPIEFSWKYNPTASEVLQSQVYFSTDQVYWQELYSGPENQIWAQFEEARYAGRKIYWYVANFDGPCPVKSPVWEFTIDMVTDAEGPSLDESLYSLFPNPGRGKFTLGLHSDLDGDLNLRLYTASGQLIREVQIESPQKDRQIEFDVSNRGKGMYILQGSGNGKQFSEKIIVQ